MANRRSLFHRIHKLSSYELPCFIVCSYRYIKTCHGLSLAVNNAERSLLNWEYLFEAEKLFSCKGFINIHIGIGVMLTRVWLFVFFRADLFEGDDVVLLKNGQRICGSGGALATAPIVQNKAYFQVSIQQSGLFLYVFVCLFILEVYKMQKKHNIFPLHLVWLAEILSNTEISSFFFQLVFVWCLSCWWVNAKFIFFSLLWLIIRDS